MNPSHPRLTHLDQRGHAHMVDVSDKIPCKRTAVATGRLVCSPATLQILQEQGLSKGDAVAVARVAGIQGAKRCSDLIPLCHPVGLDKVTLDIEPDAQGIVISATAVTVHRTGVEMEALTAVSVAALALYDMLKAVDKSMRIDGVHLVSKEKHENRTTDAE